MEEEQLHGQPDAQQHHDPQLPPVRYEDVDPYTADHRDYLLQQSRVNLLAISQMSDLKANLMLTLSAVLLQFALAKVSDHTLDGPKAHYWMMTVGALITILLCAYSTLPKAPRHADLIKAGEPLPKGFTLLFFTSYIRLPLEDYKRRMHRVLSSPPRTHEAIMEELHAHGLYIANKKYRPLRWAYITFLLTWVVGAVLYALA
ncbi:MAG TPA: DUF5706 domain-containing protein [Flavobacteriales bacterium]|nr:DUF5706 domain-containing protein [Flavobacteriales bacterium]